MQTSLYLLTSDRVPEDSSDEEHVMINTGLESFGHESDVPVESLRFATTLLVRSDDPRRLLEEVRRWWREHAGAEIDVELWATDERLFSVDMRKSAAELEDESWSFRSVFVCFSAESPEAHTDARDLVRECALVAH